MPAPLSHAAAILLGLPHYPGLAPPLTLQKEPPAAMAAPTSAAPASTAAAPVSVARTAAGGYVAHLASYRDEDAARRGWAELRAHAPGISQAEPRLLPVDLPGKGHWVRLAAGPFPNREGAAQFCASMKESAGYCRPLAVEE